MFFAERDDSACHSSPYDVHFGLTIGIHYREGFMRLQTIVQFTSIALSATMHRVVASCFFVYQAENQIRIYPDVSIHKVRILNIPDKQNQQNGVYMRIIPLIPFIAKLIVILPSAKDAVTAHAQMSVRYSIRAIMRSAYSTVLKVTVLKSKR